MNGKIRLLYVEDNPADANLTKTHFFSEAPEFEIDIAATGEKCLELLEKNTYDVLLLDYGLPDMDGLDVLRTLVQKGFLLPVVMVTGTADEEAAVAALKLGAFDYVVKRENYLTRLIYSIANVIARFQLATVNSRLQQAVIEQEQAHNALRESEGRYRDLVEHSHDLICTHDLEGRILSVNPFPAAVLGYSQDALMKMNIKDILAPEVREQFDQYLAQLKETGSAAGLMVVQTATGEKRIWEYNNTLRTEGVSFPIVRGMAHEVTETKLAQNEARIRARQQAAVVELGLRALSTTDLTSFLQETTRLVAETLNGEFCKVLELLPDGTTLLLRAGVGWKEGLVGKETVGAGKESQAGYTLLCSEPVIVEDLRRETRFSAPPFLIDHGVISGMSVVILGRGRPYGVLGADTARGRTFTRDDVNFLQAIANLLAAAIDRANTEQQILSAKEQSRKRLQDILDSMFAFVGLFSLDGILLEINRAPLEAAGLKREEVIGKPFIETYWWSYSPDVQERLRVALQRAAQGEVVRYDEVIRVANDARMNIDVTFSPLRDKAGHVVQIVGSGVDITDRKRAEEALRLAEVKYRTVVEKVPAIVYQSECGIQGRWYYVSPQIESILGFGVHEWMEDPSLWYSQLHPDDRSQAVAIEERSFFTGEPFSYEYRIFRKDGDLIWLRDEGVVAAGSSGQGLMHGVMVDITNSKRVETALRETAKRLSFVVEGTQTGMWDWDLVTNQVHYSQEWKRLLGYEEDEIGEHLDEWRRLTHPDDVESTLATVSAFLQQPVGAFEGEFRMRHKSGEYRWILSRATAQLGDDGKPVRLLGMHIDITERKRMEEALRESEAEYRMLVETMSEGLGVQDKNGLITFMNPRGCEMLGYELEELIGKPVSYAFDEENQTILSEQMARRRTQEL